MIWNMNWCKVKTTIHLRASRKCEESMVLHYGMCFLIIYTKYTVPAGRTLEDFFCKLKEPLPDVWLFSKITIAVDRSVFEGFWALVSGFCKHSGGVLDLQIFWSRHWALLSMLLSIVPVKKFILYVLFGYLVVTYVFAFAVCSLWVDSRYHQHKHWFAPILIQIVLDIAVCLQLYFMI